MNKIKKNIYTRTLEFINDKQLVAGNDNILLALSAGKDSMALLDIFLFLKPILSLNLTVFHLNHMMRGKESDDDEGFVAEIARTNKLEFFAHRFDFKEGKPRGFSFEEYARLKRYELLDQIRRDYNFQKIATAHNRDDNVETILMRIFTGTGIHGLHGIDCKRDNIIRPLIFLSAKEIYNHLIERKIQWREDSSNREEKYLRNFVRNSILPKIYERFERAGESILSLSGIAREYSSLINEFVSGEGGIYRLVNGGIVIEADNYINDKKLFKFVIANAVSDFGEFMTGGVLEEIYKKAIIKKTHILLYENKNFIIRKTLKNNKKVIVISRDIGYYDTDWEYEMDLTSIDGKSIFLREINKEFFFKIVDYDYFIKKKDSNKAIFIALQENSSNALIRNRRDGDRIKLKFGTKKIKDLLIDNKLDKHMKYSIPLIVINSKVAAFMPDPATCLSGRVSIDFYVKNDTKKILAIQSDKYQV